MNFWNTYLKDKWWQTISCLAIITILSLLPSKVFPKPYFSFEDLVVHFTMYSSLAFCLSWSVISSQKSSISYNTKWVIAIVSYGILMEILQKVLPINRFFSWSDICCNSLGALMFYYFNSSQNWFRK